MCYICIRGFPQVFRTLGALQYLMGELESIQGEHGGLKVKSLKNTCEGVHLLVKLPAIRLQACNFTNNELFPKHFLRILTYMCFSIPGTPIF